MGLDLVGRLKSALKIGVRSGKGAREALLPGRSEPRDRGRLARISRSGPHLKQRSPGIRGRLARFYSGATQSTPECKQLAAFSPDLHRLRRSRFCRLHHLQFGSFATYA